MAKVALNHVSKTYRGEKSRRVTAVEDVTLEVSDGEFVVLVGPSGCGKSTTLRMIAGLEEVSRGDIYVDDRRVNDVPPKDRDVAMVFQNYALYPHMTVYENMAFGLRLRRYPKIEIRNRVNEAAAILGIQELLDRKPKSLSGGQRQRVAVGRAIVRQPKVFLFDEPLSNLDAKMRLQMRSEIAKLHRRLQSTIIYVTHDQIEAMTMGDRIAVMNQGRVQQIDTPLKLYDEPANLFVAGFIGSPPMNLISGTVELHDNGLVFSEIAGGSIQMRLDPGSRPELRRFIGQRLRLGLRPENIKIIPPAEATKPGFPAMIDVVEPMGAETNLYLQTGAHMLICQSRRAFDQQGVGHRIKFDVEISRLHFFDPTTGNRII